MFLDIPCVGFRMKGFFPCQHLVHDDSQRIQVRASVSFFSFGLLRRYVLDSSDDQAWNTVLHDFNGFRHSEIGHVRFPAAVDQDILGLQISMDDSLLVGDHESLAYLFCDINGSIHGQSA